MQRLDTTFGVYGIAPDSVQLVTPIKSARKELEQPIDLLLAQPSQTTAPVVRTGCIPCLYASYLSDPQTV